MSRHSSYDTLSGSPSESNSSSIPHGPGSSDPKISPTGTFQLQHRITMPPPYSPGSQTHIAATTNPSDKLLPGSDEERNMPARRRTTQKKIWRYVDKASTWPILSLIRLPYCGIYRHYIKKPTKQLGGLIGRNQLNKVPIDRLMAALERWRDRIVEQLTIVVVADTLVATAGIAALSWQSIDQKARPEAWVTLALLYSSLALSVSSVLLALQQSSILKGINLKVPSEPVDDPNSPPTDDAKSVLKKNKWGRAEQMLELILRVKDKKADVGEKEYRVDPVRLYVWQAPVMMMSYGACVFVCGFSLHAVYPLFLIAKTGWTPEAKTALIFMGMGSFAMVNFVAPSLLLNIVYLSWKIYTDGDIDDPASIH
ncbi:hypothetical protein BJ508DRAFT_363613 [Ascobolus immersus RN42]|uniref:Uncharacterized protein n=1 Tax=Ascobolus immersus RN42 TaxID=1160509 RepID=A0A3N4HYD8_ASCIM|nr:hypothetical protein BJ508DRAFT_363613 [Ascobolus immersus RN42]